MPCCCIYVLIFAHGGAIKIADIKVEDEDGDGMVQPGWLALYRPTYLLSTSESIELGD